MKKLIYCGLALFIIAFQSCTPTRFVEPLEKNEISVGGTFGGPVIDFGGPIPMPITTLEIGYGLDSNLTLFGGLHTTAAYYGNLQIDLGASYQFIEQDGYLPNLSVSPSFNFIHNFSYSSTKLWPVLDLNAFWNYGTRRNYFYVGINNYFELSSTTANDQPQDHYWLFSPQLGHVLKGSKQNWQLTAEIKLLGPNLDNSTAFVPYKNLLGANGATGFFIGYRWIIGKNK